MKHFIFYTMGMLIAVLGGCHEVDPLPPTAADTSITDSDTTPVDTDSFVYGTTELGATAEMLKAGHWKRIPIAGAEFDELFHTQGITCETGSDCAICSDGAGLIIDTTDKLVWDDAGRRMYLYGTTFGGSDGTYRFLAYSERDNRLEVLPLRPNGNGQCDTDDWPDHGHSFNFATFVPSQSRYYTRIKTPGRIEYFDTRGRRWHDDIPAPPGEAGTLELGSLIHFPEPGTDGSLIYAVAKGETPSCLEANSNGDNFCCQLFIYSLQHEQWAQAQENIPCGLADAANGAHPWVRYNPVRQTILIGGGSGLHPETGQLVGIRDITEYDLHGNLTKFVAPEGIDGFGWQDTDCTLKVVDPRSGRLLVWDTQHDLWELDLETDSWTEICSAGTCPEGYQLAPWQGTSRPGGPCNGSAIAAIPDYGVIMAWNGGADQDGVYIYKHKTLD